MKWHPNTSSVLGVATFMFTVNGIIICYKAWHVPFSTWLIVVGGMAITGFTFGLIIALLASFYQYLQDRSYLRSKRYKRINPL